MTYFEQVTIAAKALRDSFPAIPQIAVVLGSGLSGFEEELLNPAEVKFSEIEGFPKATVKGHEGKFVFGETDGKKVVAVSGRLHIYEGYTAQEAVLPVRALSSLGVKTLILTNAAGGVNLGYKPGDFMIIKDYIGLFSPSPLTGAESTLFGERFISMSEAYDKELIKIGEEAFLSAGARVHTGVYAYCKGPMYETPAEVGFLRNMGADACGMSTVPEAIAAVQSGMSLMGISCITNMAAGIGDAPLCHEDVIKTGKLLSKTFKEAVHGIIRRI